jgi:UrcA family protein
MKENTMFKRTLRAAAAASATLAALTLCGAAHAQEETRSVVVAFGDLDLGNRADLARLDRRLNAAAHKVCDIADPRDARGSSFDALCRGRALTDARSELASRAVTRGGVAQVALRAR